MKVYKEKMKKPISDADTEVGSDGGYSVRKTMKHVDLQECVGKVSNKTWANIRIDHKSHKGDVTHPPIFDSHKKMWSDNTTTRVV